MTPEERAARAIRARHAQDDDVLAEAFEGAAVDIIQAWENARWSRTRERLHAELKALQRVRAKIAQYANAVPR